MAITRTGSSVARVGDRVVVRSGRLADVLGTVTERVDEYTCITFTVALDNGETVKWESWKFERIEETPDAIEPAPDARPKGVYGFHGEIGACDFCGERLFVDTMIAGPSADGPAEARICRNCAIDSGYLTQAEADLLTVVLTSATNTVSVYDMSKAEKKLAEALVSRDFLRRVGSNFSAKHIIFG